MRLDECQIANALIERLVVGSGFLSPTRNFPQRLLSGLIVVRHCGMTVYLKTTFEVFPRVGPDDSFERFTERSVGLVTDQTGNVYELFVTLFE
jgi:hypothetical protein